MTGSRAGSAIAGAWATMVFLGEEGYSLLAGLMFNTLRKIAAGIKEIVGLKLVSEPDACCISFMGDGFDVLRVADLMEKRGWKNCNRLQKPAWYEFCSHRVDLFFTLVGGYCFV